MCLRGIQTELPEIYNNNMIVTIFYDPNLQYFLVISNIQLHLVTPITNDGEHHIKMRLAIRINIHQQPFKLLYVILILTNASFVY